MDLDVLAPATIRSPLIQLTLASLATPTAFRAVSIAVTLTGDALASGLSLPVEFLVTSPSSSRSGNAIYRHVYRRTVPILITYVPKEGGLHLAVLREIAHNRVYGTLQISVAGDPLYVPS